jgi:hypothetical protein
MSHLAKILSLSNTSAVATKTTALKTYYRSVRLLKNSGTINPKQDSYITNILLNGKCIDPETRCLYVFYIDTFFNSAWIIEINIDSRTQTVVYYDKYNEIGFDADHKIYNARVVYGRLVWSDDKNPIYQMDIERAKRSFYYKIGYGQYPDTAQWDILTAYSVDQIVSNGNYLYKSLTDVNVGNEPKLDDGTNWESLCLIEDAYYSMNIENFYFEPVPPKHPPVLSYQSDDTRKINNLRQTLFQCAYRYVYIDWRKSTFSPASITPVPQAEEESATGLANEQISLNNKLNITVNAGGEEVRAIEVIGRSSRDPSKWFLIETINKFEEQERGNETSRIALPYFVDITITIPVPVVSNTATANPDGQIALGLTLPAIAGITITSLSASVISMQFLSTQGGLGDALSSVLTCLPNTDNIVITSISSWITVWDNSGNYLWVNSNLSNSDTIRIAPTEPNSDDQSDGPNKIGSVVLESSSGDILTIVVRQTGWWYSY